jgi:tRNA A37 methylthiotransferase MiaB
MSNEKWLLCSDVAYIADTLPVECHKCHKPLVMDAKNALMVEQEGLQPICMGCCDQHLQAHLEDKVELSAIVGGQKYSSLPKAITAALKRLKESKEEKPQ